MSILLMIMLIPFTFFLWHWFKAQVKKSPEWRSDPLEDIQATIIGVIVGLLAQPGVIIFLILAAFIVAF